MKKVTSIFILALLALSIFTTNAVADANRGKMVYMKKLKSACKLDDIKNGGLFALKHDRRGWAALKEQNKLKSEWSSICPHAEKKIKRMRDKDVKNLYDFVWKYASDGEVPTCG